MSAGSTSDASKLARLAKLHDLLIDLAEKQRAVLDEISALHRGEPGIGQRLKEVQSAWQRAIEQKYPGRKYQFDYVKDVPHMKKWLRDGYTLDTLAAMFLRYVLDDPDDEWLARETTKKRHPFSLFVHTFNQWVPEGRETNGFTLTGDEPRRPPGCPPHHTPPCRDAAACTDRKLSERAQSLPSPPRSTPTSTPSRST